MHYVVYSEYFRWEEVVAFRLSVCERAQIAFFSLDFTIFSARRPQGTLP